MKFTHEYTPNGRHRIVAISPGGVNYEGDLAGYRDLAILKTPHGDYFAATDYWSGTFTVDTVYKFQTWTVATTTETPEEITRS